MIILAHTLWVKKNVEPRVTKQCNIKFSINLEHVDEVKVDIVPFDVCTVVFKIPYMCMRDAIFMRRDNQYCLIKDQKFVIINTHKGKSNISLISANEAKNLISSSRKFILFFLR